MAESVFLDGKFHRFICFIILKCELVFIKNNCLHTHTLLIFKNKKKNKNIFIRELENVF